eukprot:12875273-Ditylum_brightwellii.AAC.1
MAELLVELDLNLYCPYHSVKVALLFWKNFSSSLVKWRFKTNPNGWCIANKTIDGKQCTLAWYINDLKISHVKDIVVIEIIGKLEKNYGKEAPLTVRRGKTHDFLEMKLDFTKSKKVVILMEEFIIKLLDGLPDELNGVVVTPTVSHLFDTYEDAKKLEKKMYNSSTTTLLNSFFHAREQGQICK